MVLVYIDGRRFRSEVLNFELADLPIMLLYEMYEYQFTSG